MKRNPVAKKYGNLYKSSFKIGFECEFLLISNRLSYNNAYDAIRNIHPSIEVGGDGSIDAIDDCCCNNIWSDRQCNACSQIGIEARTPPLLPYESMTVLKNMFQFISHYGVTNRTCGLHANFSPVSDEVYYSVDPYKIFNNSLWEKMKIDFDRVDNDYCERTPWNHSRIENTRIETKTPLERFLDGDEDDSNYQSYGYDGHSSEVNFDNYYNPRREYSRIEIRCMGNENYHKKFPLVAHYVNQTIEVFRTGYGKRFD